MIKVSSLVAMVGRIYRHSERDFKILRHIKAHQDIPREGGILLYYIPRHTKERHTKAYQGKTYQGIQREGKPRQGITRHTKARHIKAY